MVAGCVDVGFGGWGAVVVVGFCMVVTTHNVVVGPVDVTGIVVVVVTASGVVVVDVVNVLVVVAVCSMSPNFT